MSRLQTVVHHSILEMKSAEEYTPHQSLTSILNRDFLYGNTEEDLDTWLNMADQFAKLIEKPVVFWQNLLQETLVDNPLVVVQGQPDAHLVPRLRREEEERVHRQREQLGEQGLVLKHQELHEAIADNSRLPVETVLSVIPSSNTTALSFFNISSVNSSSQVQLDGFNLTTMPVFFKFDQINSKFVSLFTVLDTEHVPHHQRPLLPLLLELLLKSPLATEDGLMNHHEVTTALSTDCIKFSLDLGINGAMFRPGPSAQSAVLFLMAESSNYDKAVAWIHRLLFRTVVTAERVREVAASMLTTTNSLRQNGGHLVSAIMSTLLFSKESNIRVANVIKQKRFLDELLKKLEGFPDDVVQELEALKTLLLHPSGVAVYMAGDLSLLSAPLAPWSSLLTANMTADQRGPGPRPDHLLTRPPPRHVVLALATTQTCHLEVTTPAITTATTPATLAALLLAIHYVQPAMVARVRGAGLAYGLFLEVSSSTGQVTMKAVQAGQPFAAYMEAKAVVTAQASPNATWNPALLLTARNSLVFKLIQGEQTLSGAVVTSLTHFLTGTSRELALDLLAAIQNVTEGNMRSAIDQHVANLFSPELSRTSLVCGPTEAERAISQFGLVGVNLVRLDTLEDLNRP